ncbi:platelet glycoprotein Ib alpha chain [Engraulis encrasicolus]|uniref:platelet glycoprotein Ib alpha chain n=1 Tax=Engraulis encrasicolus TaxID=184585 RepID=UPI002FD30A68
MDILLFLALLFLCPLPNLVSAEPQCHSDKDENDRARVTCGAMGLSSVPADIDPASLNLNLTHNLFTSLDWGAYTGFPGLHTLDLRHNRVEKLEGSGTLAELSKLHLSNNQLVDLPARAFINAPKLMEVFLRSNHLRSVHNESFSGLPILEIVDLSRNRLTTLPPDFLAQISSTTLKTLDLEENQIRDMPHNWFVSKPDLPYVFLSKNPWKCYCEVGYLQVYLEDQEFNVYVHTNPDSPNPLLSIENDPESVVCAHPPSMLDRPIMNLKEEDYCDKALLSEATPPPLAPAAPAQPFGDIDGDDVVPTTFAPTTKVPTTTAPTTKVPTTTAPTTKVPSVVVPTTKVPTTVAPTTKIPTVVALTTTAATTTTAPTTTAEKTTTAAEMSTVAVVDTTTASSTTTVPVTTAQNVITTPFALVASTLPKRVMTWTRRWLESWTVRHVWTESWTSRHEESFNWSSDWSSFWVTTSNWRSEHTPDPTTTPWTTTTTTASDSPPPSTPAPPTPSSTLSHPNALPPGDSTFGGSRGERAGARAWCTWLFAALLLLCLLSALGSCLLILGLARAYLTLYRPLARKVAKSKGAGDASVRLLDYQAKACADVDDNGLGGYGGMALPAFLPIDASGGVQASFRSVLFIDKKGEGEEEEKEDGKEEKKRDEKEEEKEKKVGDGKEEEGKEAEAAATGKTGLQISSVGAGLAVVKRRNPERTEGSGRENNQVFRKTLYRVFSHEEEVEGWKHVEEHWEEKRGMTEAGERKEDRRKRVSVIGGGAGADRKTRYSLILREEKVESDRSREQEGGMEWLVGEWEMGGLGGRMNEGDWASLFSGIGEDGPTSSV